MILGQVKKMDILPVKTRYAVGAGALFVILLTALVHVVKGQVEQAQLRQLQSQAMQAALSDCAAHPSGGARRQCVAQLNARLATTIDQPADEKLRSAMQPELSGLPVGQGLPNGSTGSAELDRRGLTETAFVPR